MAEDDGRLTRLAAVGVGQARRGPVAGVSQLITGEPSNPGGHTFRP